MLKDLIKDFCENNSDKYYIHENCSAKGMYGKLCIGIVVRMGYSYMQMFMELTSYLADHDFEDVDFELENPAVDNLGLDTIVYFPNSKVGD